MQGRSLIFPQPVLFSCLFQIKCGALLRHRNRRHIHAAIRVFEALRALRTSTCDEADAEARRLAETITAAADAEQARYDRQSGHGRTQGAVWPPR